MSSSSESTIDQLVHILKGEMYFKCNDGSYIGFNISRIPGVFKTIPTSYSAIRQQIKSLQNTTNIIDPHLIRTLNTATHHTSSSSSSSSQN